ncbi:MAG: imidazole glycerol phosphate synthase subunit HisH [Gemmatimonadota bacterium]|nr:imidazole glycerol phosphate synthase subunit HisH [Gemmatimonadota bacterium]
MTQIGIFDYGAGNLHSLVKAIEGDDRNVTVDTDIGSALAADILILPGVGAFGAAVTAMRGAQGYVRDALADGKPCLGVCLGMQMLFDASEEAPGANRGIGLIPGQVTRLVTPKVPHMGWNEIEWVGTGKREEGRGKREAGSGKRNVTDDPPPISPVPLPSSRFPLRAAYFANAYVCGPEDDSTVLAWTTHQNARFASVVRAANTVGVQFHPEKSSIDGRTFVNAVIDELLQCR